MNLYNPRTHHLRNNGSLRFCFGELVVRRVLERGRRFSDRLSDNLRKVLFSVTAAVFLAACTNGQDNFATVGIGSNLTSPNTQKLAELQNKYFNYLCEQSGLDAEVIGFEGASCVNELGLVNDNWTFIVHQGMNDIDRRCDQFLQWLDEQRRAEGPLLAQVNSISDVTNAILGFTDTSQLAINIVAQSFGLLTKSLEHYHDLLINIEGSTVNSVVLNRRNEFRVETKDYVYNTRPAAEHALRSYLRVCLPFSIKSNVNDFSTLSSQGVVNPGQQSINKIPTDQNTPGINKISFSPLTGETKTNTQQNRKPRPGAPGDWNKVSGGLTIDLSTAQSIQRALCFTGTEIDGTYGPMTETGLKLFESVVDGKLNDTEWRDEEVVIRRDLGTLRTAGTPDANGTGDCPNGAGNYLEARMGSTLIEAVAKAVEAPDAKDFTSMRTQIKAYRSKNNFVNDPDDMFADQVTPEMLAVIAPSTR